MKNATNKIRFLESFVIATFPIALVVGCTATGEQKPQELVLQEGVQQEATIQQETSRDAAEFNMEELNTLTFVETDETNNEIHGVPQQITTETEITAEETSAEMISMDTVASIDASIESDTQPETQVMQVNLSIPDVSKVEKPEKTIFNFAISKHDIVEEDYANLKAHADYLLENPNVVVNVNGYSDNRGSAKSNYELSQKRAQQIANVLMSHGVPKSQIIVNSYGESFPLNDENNWDENRRVELQYMEDLEKDGLILSAF